MCIDQTFCTHSNHSDRRLHVLQRIKKSICWGNNGLFKATSPTDTYMYTLTVGQKNLLTCALEYKNIRQIGKFLQREISIGVQIYRGWPKLHQNCMNCPHENPRFLGWLGNHGNSSLPHKFSHDRHTIAKDLPTPNTQTLCLYAMTALDLC